MTAMLKNSNIHEPSRKKKILVKPRMKKQNKTKQKQKQREQIKENKK